MTCLKALREAARVEVKPDVQDVLKAAAIQLEDAIWQFCIYQDTKELITLNGAWSHAWLTLRLATPVPDPTTPTSIVEEERKAA